MKRLFPLLLLLSIAGFVSAQETISIQIQMIDPESRENRDLINNIIVDSAARASRVYGEYIRVGQNSDSAQYELQLMAIIDDENPLMVASFTKLSTGENISQSLLGEITDDSHRYLSEVIFKLWADMNSEKLILSTPLPQFMEEIPSRFITEAVAPGFSGYSTASAVAVKKNGNIILAMGSLCYEMTEDFNILSQIGGDIFNQSSAIFAFGASVTPGGTVYLKPTGGREIIRVIEGSPRSVRVRAGIDVNGPMAILNNGICILYHTTSQKFIRIDGSKRSEIDLNLGPYSYVFAMAAGPEGNLWIHDSMEQRFKIYSDDGTFINSVIPVGLGGETLTPMSMTIYNSGEILLYSNSALYKFSKEGILLWKMAGYHFREEESFPVTPVNLAVDSQRGFIYMADYSANRLLKFFDPSGISLQPDDRTETVLRLNENIDRDPDSSEYLWDKIDFYLNQESWILAKLWLEELTTIKPFDDKAQTLLVQMELKSLLSQVQELKNETAQLIEKLGPESARQKFSQTVQLFEKILSLNPANNQIISDLNRFKETFNRESATVGSQQKPLTIASIHIENIFPSLIHYYQNNPVGTVLVKNDLQVPIQNIRAELSLRQFIDFPIESIIIPALQPGEEIAIGLNILLNEKAFNIEEDLPLLAQVNVHYEVEDEMQSVAKTTGATLYRRTALSWDNTAKLAAFIMPNEGVVSAFSHRVLKRNLQSDGLPPKLVKAARICDALGTYGISYVEDPDSPFSLILGKEQHVDTVRYPRTTLNIQSGDCDDTTALLASLLESSGIKTAIMTSPGHVFTAFDSEEPIANRWMFEQEGFTTIAHGGTIWIPIETTVLSEGFYNAWASASSIILNNRQTDIDFVPVKEQREMFPPLPLVESNMIIVEPSEEQIDPLNTDSLENLRNSLYVTSVSSLEAQIPDNSLRKQRQLNNKLGILHARFGEFHKAESLFRNLIQENPSYLSPYMNLGNLFYSQKEFEIALDIYEEAKEIKPESLMVNLALAKTFHQLDDISNTKKFFNVILSRSETLSDQFAYLVDNNNSTRAGIDEEPPITWDIEE